VHAPSAVVGLRVVAAAAALDRAIWPAGAIVLRLAPDDVLLLDAAVTGGLGDRSTVAVDDGDAIVARDAGFAVVEIAEPAASALLASVCAWPLPTSRPALAQGAIAGLPGRLWLEPTRVLVLVPAPLAAELAERLAAAGA